MKKNRRKEEYSELSEIIVALEVMRGKHTFYRHIYCHSFCETGPLKRFTLLMHFPPFPFQIMPFLEAFPSQENWCFQCSSVVCLQEVQAETFDYLYTAEGGEDFSGSCCMAHGSSPLCYGKKANSVVLCSCILNVYSAVLTLNGSIYIKLCLGSWNFIWIKTTRKLPLCSGISPF